jgi:hypothetical protein
MEINLKAKERVKAFFKEGRLALVLKLKLPYFEGENERFNLRANAFYEELMLCYIRECERVLNQGKPRERPISLQVEFEENRVNVCAIFVTRTHKLRLPTGEKREFSSLDAFDSQTGLLIHAPKKPKRNINK